jgi:hypothetical protein
MPGHSRAMTPVANHLKSGPAAVDVPTRCDVIPWSSASPRGSLGVSEQDTATPGPGGRRPDLHAQDLTDGHEAVELVSPETHHSRAFPVRTYARVPASLQLCSANEHPDICPLGGQQPLRLARGKPEAPCLKSLAVTGWEASLPPPLGAGVGVPLRLGREAAGARRVPTVAEGRRPLRRQEGRLSRHWAVGLDDAASRSQLANGAMRSREET